jgi:predicted transcriptional regulator
MMSEPLLIGISQIAEYWQCSRSTVKRRLKDLREGGFVIRRWIRKPGKMSRRVWVTTPSRLERWVVLKAKMNEDF